MKYTAVILAAKVTANRLEHTRKGLNMSSSAPKKHRGLWTQAKRGNIHRINDMWPQTVLLFAIFDREWVGWYKFYEASQQINDAVDFGLHQRLHHKTTDKIYAHQTLSVHFHPTEPMRVNEFASDNPVQPTQADLESAFPENELNGIILMRLTLWLDSRPQTIPLNARLPKEPNPEERPYAIPKLYEQGVVNLIKVEEYTPAHLNNYMRFF